ncbi:MAG: NAD-dependent deacylase [Gemmobacter sp.]
MAEPVVILTGAGVSAESGLGTFRDKGGIWARFDPARLATPEAFAADPAQVHTFYNLRRANCLDAAPNPAHHALARLGRDWPGEVVLITQNVDDLHERAGSTGVIHMHGRLARALCAACAHRWDAPREMRPTDRCPRCGETATRPDIVWFGEYPYHMDRIAAAVARAGLFAVIGSSGQVYPAAGLVGEARAAGARTVEINLEPSARADAFDDALYGPASETVPHWVAGLLDGG